MAAAASNKGWGGGEASYDDHGKDMALVTRDGEGIMGRPLLMVVCRIMACDNFNHTLLAPIGNISY